MRGAILVLFLAAFILGCDSDAPGGLDGCEFEMTLRGDLQGDTSGRAYFWLQETGALPPNPAHILELRLVREGPSPFDFGSVDLRGEFPTLPGERLYRVTLQPPPTPGGPFVFGNTTGGSEIVVFEGGSLEIDRFSEKEIEGSFELSATTRAGARLNMLAEFFALSDADCRM